jgi:hypothetical protein
LDHTAARRAGILHPVLLVADLGPLHARLPAYNAQTVVELLRFLGAARVVLAGLSPSQFAGGGWRDLENPVLFALDAERFPLEAAGPDWDWAEAEAGQFREFLGAYPQGRARLREAEELESGLRGALGRPLDAEAAHGPELLGAVRAYHRGIAGLLEEGPGTAHRVLRLEAVGRALAGLDLEGAAVLVPLDDLPDLLDLPGAERPGLAGFSPGEASRARALVDRAYQLEEGDDLDALVRGLLALEGRPGSALGRLALEARFAAAGVYLAVGDLESARGLMEEVAHGHLDKPAYLPGFALARLGQVRDLVGERDPAVRAYRAALGLSWLPAEARRVAEAGLEAPFSLG